MTIAGAIDKINDKLAGTDKYAPVTIEGALDKLAETIPEGGWSGGGGSAFDGEIIVTLPEGSSEQPTIEIKVGTYAGIVGKFNDGGVPDVLLYVKGPDSVVCRIANTLVFDENLIIVNASTASVADNGTVTGVPLQLHWNSNDTVTLPD